VPTEMLYQVVKAVFDNFDEFKKLHPALAHLKPEQMISDGLWAPLHDGALKYYKEKGWIKQGSEERDGPAGPPFPIGLCTPLRRRPPMATDIEKAPAALQELVAEVDTGLREPRGVARQLVFGTVLAWSLFQLWYASPLPFVLRVGVLNDTEARSIHLAFSLFPAFLAWPAFKDPPRKHIPLPDWAFALAGAFGGGYLLLFCAQLATRPGQPTTMDIVVASAGIVLLLEATRRAVAGRWPRWPCSSWPMPCSGPTCPRSCRTRARR
jgi:hypothetical protein